jgi:hypothetical protein
VFAYSPLLLLAPWLLRRLWASARAECLTLLGIVLTFLLVCAQFWSWSGLWAAPGPRYLFVATPLLLAPLGLWLDAARARGARAPFAAAFALALLGAAAQVAVTCSSWNSVVEANGWRRFEPGMDFLFVPAESPILAGARALAAGWVDGWIWWIGRGWRAQPAAPAAALALLGGGAALLGLCAAGALRALRRHPEAGHPPRLG